MSLHPTAPLGALLSVGGATAVLVLRQGTPGAALAGAAVALVSTAGFGASSFWPMAVFVLGAGVLTNLGRERKQELGVAERNRGRRASTHVFAKLGLPALLGAAAIGDHGSRSALALAFTAALSGAFADTAGTELGPLAGGSVLVRRGLRFARGPHGTPGGVSAAGILAAAVAAAALAWSARGVGLLTDGASAWAAAAAGLVATLAESTVAGSAMGTRMGHFGRNLFVSVASAALALALHAGGWCRA